MSEYGTIKIPREDFKRHKERRKDLGLKWLDYIEQESVEVSNGSEASFSDMVNACEKALDNKLPDEVTRR